MKKLVRLKDLDLESGDSVVTAKGTFVVIESRTARDLGEDKELELRWLETGQHAVIWEQDSVYGPVEVHRKAT